MIRIVNENDFDGEGIYVGRPSVLGNPFVIGKDGNRSQVIKKYIVWLRMQCESRGPVKRELMKLARMYRKKGKLTLVCWCAPKACHADVLKKVIMSLVKK
jgi:hypothetical protein